MIQSGGCFPLGVGKRWNPAWLTDTWADMSAFLCLCAVVWGIFGRWTSEITWCDSKYLLFLIVLFWFWPHLFKFGVFACFLALNFIVCCLYVSPHITLLSVSFRSYSTLAYAFIGTQCPYEHGSPSGMLWWIILAEISRSSRHLDATRRAVRRHVLSSVCCLRLVGWNSFVFVNLQNGYADPKKKSNDPFSWSFNWKLHDCVLKTKTWGKKDMDKRQIHEFSAFRVWKVI